MRDYRYWYWEKPKERLLMWSVGKLPRELVARAAIRVIAHATTAQWSNQVVPELGAMEALQRWDSPHVR